MMLHHRKKFKIALIIGGTPVAAILSLFEDRFNIYPYQWLAFAVQATGLVFLTYYIFFKSK